MDTAETILVIITSSLLSLFLLVGIFVMVAVLKLVKSIRTVVAKAEDVVDSAEAVTEAFKSASGPLSLLKLVKNIMSLVDKHKK